MLSILNASVSHELRNPLNSIIGQNIQKQGLIEILRIQVNKLDKKSKEQAAIAREMESIIQRMTYSLQI